MSFYGSWPVYKIKNFRGAGELLWKFARLSWKIDRVALPLTLPLFILFHFYGDKIPFTPNERVNPYTEACLKKKEEGKYNGSLVGIRPEKYF